MNEPHKIWDLACKLQDCAARILDVIAECEDLVEIRELALAAGEAARGIVEEARYEDDRFRRMPPPGRCQ